MENLPAGVGSGSWYSEEFQRPPLQLSDEVIQSTDDDHDDNGSELLVKLPYHFVPNPHIEVQLDIKKKAQKVDAS